MAHREAGANALGAREGTSWTGHQSIAKPTQRRKAKEAKAVVGTKVFSEEEEGRLKMFAANVRGRPTVSLTRVGNRSLMSSEN